MLHTLRRGVSRALPLAVACGFLIPASGSAQARQATVRVEENLRAEPNGVVVAVVEPGTSMRLVRERGNWVEVVLEGWIWEASLLTRDGGNFDFQVGEPEGENLRDQPQGAVRAQLTEGALLVELDRRPGWIRVRRQAWMWAPSVEIGAAEASGASAGGGSGGGGSTATRTAPAGSPTASSTSRIYRGAEGAPVLNSPDGDTLALLSGQTEMTISAREGNWARVRLDGWVWMPPVVATDGSTGGDVESAVSPTLSQVMQNPDAYDGRLVTWTLQFVSLEEAEAVRTDFYEGEPFLLTRPVDSASTRFVYVAVPPESMAAAQGLVPLERITVVGRVRTGSSTLTGAPILNLVELR